MIEKMKFVSITGPKADIDRVVDQYLSKYEIHLENALAQLKTVQNLSPFIEINPYKNWLTKAIEFQALLDPNVVTKEKTISLEEAVELIQKFDSELSQIILNKKALEEEQKNLLELLEKVKPFLSLNLDTSAVEKYKYVYCRFGRIAKDYFAKFESYVYEAMDTLFCQSYEDDTYIWGAYFCPRAQANRINAAYASMHFEQIDVPKELYGQPKEVNNRLEQELSEIKEKLQRVQKEISALTKSYATDIVAAKKKLESHSKHFDVRKLAACTKEENQQVFYILCGWMSERDANAFQEEMDEDETIYCFTVDDEAQGHGEPPTKLKNPKIFKPFEMFIHMYGLPSYHEIDPTIFVALTYIFIFGAMFGDAGQGICLCIGGFLLYKFKKMDLVAILGLAGIFSTFFGFMFGSVFGFEDILPAIWLHPVSAMSDVPFLGKLNTVFVVAIGFGMILILITMIFNIINGIKNKDVEKIFFDQNAIAGLVFYGSLVAVILLFISGKTVPAGIVLGIMFGIPLIIIMLKEPLTKIVKKEAPVIEDGIGMFFVQSFFELFEIMLSYLSNTLSFVRIGAFAVSHAAMMEVVLMLAGAEAGNPNWIVIVFGNIFVTAMEGLIVAIQVLRLEYYEMFSRFYKGSGRPFTPFISKNNK